MPIARALLSVSDKSGLLDFAKGLAELGVELLSTGGTSKHLKDGGLKVIDVSEHTGFPEMFDGRVKTLHPKVHGGLLQRRDNEEDKKNAKKHDIPVIDLVIVNLYPFEQTVAKKDVTLEEAIENIDIGGPSMLRSAAKNHRWVTVISDPADYAGVLAEMKENIPPHSPTPIPVLTVSGAAGAKANSLQKSLVPPKHPSPPCASIAQR